NSSRVHRVSRVSRAENVDTPQDIIDVVDKDDDIFNEEDPIPHDLTDSDDEDLVNLDIDDGVNMLADVVRGHDDDDGCDDRSPSYQMETSATREYPSLIYIFFLKHTVGGAFLNPEDKALYDEMLRLQGLGSNTPTGVPYTEDEIMAIVRGGKQWGTFPVLKKHEKRLTKQVNMFVRLFRSDNKFFQMLTQLESQPEYGGGSGSGECADDEPGDDEDGGEDDEDENDS
nr:hypothetical protein [Tanacetum cinerariifolium]